ncbi:PucR family transcriptional regulator ligand-binding domain-containing protein [uncultured Mycolicibacterium sp.]|uniref:PucR family transcriptional regulator n=1 Tax=uncultured Mycolicibacterium sp. TaxID=2320817 RepID=UPI0032B1F091
MAITARSLTQVKNLGLALVAGAEAADREIDWAHAIELSDPTPYLAGGELVMTTGINIGTDDAAQLDYVARLVTADAAALAVDTGTTLSEVPAGVLAAGDALGMPVLEVPRSTPFIAIARVVIDALKADELRSVQRVVDEQEFLARATLRGGIPGAVSALADSLSAEVIVADTDGTILAAAGGGQERLTAVLSEAVRKAASNRQAGYVTADGDGFVTVQKLRTALPVRGHLAVRTAHPMYNAHRLLVSHAVSLISIAMEKPARVVDAEQRLRRAVTREMVCGTGNVDVGMLRYFGFDPRDEVVVVVLTGAGPTLAAEQVLDRLLASAGPYLMTTVSDEMVIVIPAACGRRIPDVLTGLANESGEAIRGGASEPIRIAEIDKGVEQARIASLAEKGSRFTEFGQLDVFGVLLGGRGNAELRVLAGPLEPLVEQGEELLAALVAFLTHNGQIEAAATGLGIHRHTMRNRMQRITELLADDVQSADTRTQLWLAIRARELLAIRSRAGASFVDSRWSSTTAPRLSNWMQPEGTTDGGCFPGPKHAQKPPSCVGTPLHR